MKNVELMMESEASVYERRYEELITESAEAVNRRMKGAYEWGKYDTVALGRYLANYEKMLPAMESDNTVRDSMNDILKVGLGLAALQYVALPIQLLASVQPLADEAGVVYFRKAIANTTRGGVTAGDELIHSMGNQNPALMDYPAEQQIVTINGFTTANGTTAVAFNLGANIRQGRVIVNLQDASGNTLFTAKDDMAGHLFGVGIDPSSTVDYVTGNVSVKLMAAPASNLTAAVQFDTDLTTTNPAPSFKWSLDKRTINVKYWLLESRYSILANHLVKQRFGVALADDIAIDTVAQINGAVLYSAIRALRNAAIANEQKQGSSVTWAATPPSGVSLAEHRQTFSDALEGAGNFLAQMCGRNQISFMIAGNNSRMIMRTTGAAFEVKSVPGPYYMGTYEGIPVFYAPPSLVPADEVIVGYRGVMWFESSLVYAPFLPVTTVEANSTVNTFTNAIGVAHGAGLEITAPEFICRIKIV